MIRPVHRQLDIVSRLAARRGFWPASLLLEWPEIIGAHFAPHVQPLKLQFPREHKRDGILEVACPSIFAPELQHSQQLLLEKINTRFGYKAVSRLVIRHVAFAPRRQASAAMPMPPAPLVAHDTLDAVVHRLQNCYHQQRAA